ncbi:hypothetical protein ACIBO6_33940, partial [Streptomyces luteogriseus]
RGLPAGTPRARTGRRAAALRATTPLSQQALGVSAFVVSFGLFMAATWARVIGVAIAGLVIIANFLSLPNHPVWSIVMIALSGFIIWALCVMRKDDAFAPPERPPGR